MKKQKQKTRKNNFFESLKHDKLKLVFVSCTVLILVIAIIIFLGLLSYKNSILSVTELNATINVSDYIGFNLDKDKLHFGAVFPGGSSVRELTLNSEKEGYVYVIVDKEFSDWIYTSAQGEFIPENMYFPMKLKLKCPSDVAPGDYSFQMKIIITDKKTNFISNLFFDKLKAKQEYFTESEGSGKIQLNIVNSSIQNLE